jgi:hypothetical protein
MNKAFNLTCNVLAILCIPLAIAYYAFIMITFAGLTQILINNLKISWLLILLALQTALGSYGWISLYKLYKTRHKNTCKAQGCINAGIIFGILSIAWNPLMLVCATPPIALSAILLYSRACRVNV